MSSNCLGNIGKVLRAIQKGGLAGVARYLPNVLRKARNGMGSQVASECLGSEVYLKPWESDSGCIGEPFARH